MQFILYRINLHIFQIINYKDNYIVRHISPNYDNKIYYNMTTKKGEKKLLIIAIVTTGIILVLYSACVVSGRCSKEEEKIELIKEKNK